MIWSICFNLMKEWTTEINLLSGVVSISFCATTWTLKYEGGVLEMFLTDSQKSYYMAMKKLGRKKPRKMIRRPINSYLALFYDISMSRRWSFFTISCNSSILWVSIPHFRCYSTATDSLTKPQLCFLFTAIMSIKYQLTNNSRIENDPSIQSNSVVSTSLSMPSNLRSNWSWPNANHVQMWKDFVQNWTKMILLIAGSKSPFSFSSSWIWWLWVWSTTDNLQSSRSSWSYSMLCSPPCLLSVSSWLPPRWFIRMRVLITHIENGLLCVQSSSSTGKSEKCPMRNICCYCCCYLWNDL